MALSTCNKRHRTEEVDVNTQLLCSKEGDYAKTLQTLVFIYRDGPKGWLQHLCTSKCREQAPIFVEHGVQYDIKKFNVQAEVNCAIPHLDFKLICGVEHWDQVTTMQDFAFILVGIHRMQMFLQANGKIDGLPHDTMPAPVAYEDFGIRQKHAMRMQYHELECNIARFRCARFTPDEVTRQDLFLKHVPAKVVLI
eukprot:762433-Hanusia_phi.AAC.3